MTAPRRRWSFSLRTLFVVMTACALASPIGIAKYREWQAARAKVELPPFDFRDCRELSVPAPAPAWISTQSGPGLRHLDGTPFDVEDSAATQVAPAE